MNNRHLVVEHGKFHYLLGCYPNGDCDWTEGSGTLELELLDNKWFISYDNTGDYGDAPKLDRIIKSVNTYDEGFKIFK